MRQPESRNQTDRWIYCSGADRGGHRHSFAGRKAAGRSHRGPESIATSRAKLTIWIKDFELYRLWRPLSTSLPQGLEVEPRRRSSDGSNLQGSNCQGDEQMPEDRTVTLGNVERSPDGGNGRQDTATQRRSSGRETARCCWSRGDHAPGGRVEGGPPHRARQGQTSFNGVHREIVRA